MKKAFDNEKYLKLQSENILKRMSMFGDKLYLEFGGKLFDDYHASRVLPGFEPDTKLKMLLTIKDKVEIIIAISALDILRNKTRGDYGITYQSDVLRMIDAFREAGLYVGSVCVTQYQQATQVDDFIKKLNILGVKTYKRYVIENYPHDVEKIISDEGFGRDEYIETTRPVIVVTAPGPETGPGAVTTRPVIVVTAPGPGSGKMATCLSQLYNENKRGVKAGYAKYETFPIWNLSLANPVNLAYEAATADLADVNMIDRFHLEAYNEVTVNYNRDIETFPVLKQMFTKIYGKSPYQSPTDMGVNMAGFAICDMEAASKASKDEIIRRYLSAKVEFRNGKFQQEAVDKIALLMKQLDLSLEDRKVIAAAQEKKELTNVECMALELEDGTIITAKTSQLLLAPAALLLNALKHLAGIDDKFTLLSKAIIEPVSNMKIKTLGNHNPKLHADEVLIALSISAQTNPLAEAALKQVPLLKGTQAHSTVILDIDDSNVFKKLKIDLTTNAEVYAHKLYVK